MNNILLSIIIPAFNAEKYITDCLKSVGNLLNDNIEILVINDGSTDGTADKVNECIETNNAIKLINVKNGGVSKARNTGLYHACGKYIMFLDADDYLIENTFSDVNAVVSSDDYDFAAFARDIIEENGHIWHEGFHFDEVETNSKDITDSIMYSDSLFNECWGKLYRRDLIESFNIRFPDGIPVGEDLMFVMEYYSHCNKVYASNKSLVGYRQHGGSAMRKYSVSDRIKFTNDLYVYAKKYVPESLKNRTGFYYFKVLTNLCREYSRGKINKPAIKDIYMSKMTEEVLLGLKGKDVPLYRKHEYLMMKKRLYGLSAVYYFFKAKR